MDKVTDVKIVKSAEKKVPPNHVFTLDKAGMIIFRRKLFLFFRSARTFCTTFGGPAGGRAGGVTPAVRAKNMITYI